MEKRKQRKKRFRLGVIILFGFFILTGFGLYFFWEKVPYQSQAARQFQKILASYGLEAKNLKVESISSTKALFSNIQLGASHPLKIGKLSASYSLGELRSGYIHLLGINDPSLEAYQDTAKSWQIGGLESLKLPASEGPAFSAFDTGNLQSKLPSGIVVANGSLQVKGEALQALIPFDGIYQNAPSPSISLQLPTLSTTLGDFGLTGSSGAIDAELNPETKEWKGKVDAYKVIITGLPQEMPQMRLSGTFNVNEKTSKGDFTLNDAKNIHQSRFALSVPNTDPGAGTLTVKSLQFPYAGGIVSTKSVKVPLAGDKPIKVALQFENLSLAELATLTSGGKVQATGAISGTLPLTYYPDGKIVLHDGAASAKENGTIIVSPESIPGGDREELHVVRTALQNFHYTTLSLQVLSGAEETSTIQLKVEGNNPEAFGGKKVKLNVNLTGDILPMIQQSLQSLNDVGSLLRSETK